jgi:hypothetical protein
VLIVHHAGKGGEQRGTSRREDVLDTSISLRRPSDYLPTEGARFEVHFEKARGIHGERAKPFEAKLEIRDGAMLWTIREIEDVNLARVKALLDDELSIRDIADETGLSKSTVHRLKKQIERGDESCLGQSPSSVSHGNGSSNCPKTSNPSGTPGSLGKQGFSPTVPLSQPLGGRDVGHLTVGSACQACDGLGCPTCQPERFGLQPKSRLGELKDASLDPLASADEPEAMTEKRKVRIGRLTTVGQVAGELGRLYRQARRGDVAVADASRLATILAAMRQCLEASELERRITEMEVNTNPVVPFRRGMR